MNKYTNIILTVIALCLIAIVVKLWQPSPAYSGFLDDGPTWGEYRKSKNKIDIIDRMPVVKIHGSVDVD